MKALRKALGNLLPQKLTKIQKIEHEEEPSMVLFHEDLAIFTYDFEEGFVCPRNLLPLSWQQPIENPDFESET